MQRHALHRILSDQITSSRAWKGRPNTSIALHEALPTAVQWMHRSKQNALCRCRCDHGAFHHMFSYIAGMRPWVSGRAVLRSTRLHVIICNPYIETVHDCILICCKCRRHWETMTVREHAERIFVEYEYKSYKDKVEACAWKPPTVNESLTKSQMDSAKG